MKIRCRYVYQTPTLGTSTESNNHKNCLATSRINVLATSRINVLATSRINVLATSRINVQTGFLAVKNTQINFWRTAGVNVWHQPDNGYMWQTCRDSTAVEKANLPVLKRRPGRDKGGTQAETKVALRPSKYHGHQPDDGFVWRLAEHRQAKKKGGANLPRSKSGGEGKLAGTPAALRPKQRWHSGQNKGGTQAETKVALRPRQRWHSGRDFYYISVVISQQL
jgi:hypothetical protein